MINWKPIATAPKIAGKRLLLLFPNTHCGPQAITADWIEPNWITDIDYIDGAWGNPTHWVAFDVFLKAPEGEKTDEN